MNRNFAILCCAVLAVGLLWFFPLVHIERLDSPTSEKVTQSSNTSEFAKAFWDEKLVPSIEKAPDAMEVLSALRDNPQMARTTYGRKVGVSRSTLFIIQGKGAVESVDKKGVGVALAEGSEKPEIVLHTALLFGNTVRDATGLLDAGTFQDSRQFNEISTELNRLVETRVIAPLKEKAVKGQHIRFIGCFEASNQDEPATPLLIIPMQVRFE